MAMGQPAKAVATNGRRVAVIGAGGSGLSAIREADFLITAFYFQFFSPRIESCQEKTHALQYKLSVTCFEGSGSIGGLWRYKPEPEKLTSKKGMDYSNALGTTPVYESSVMKSTIINTSKELNAYSDPEMANYMHNTELLRMIATNETTSDRGGSGFSLEPLLTLYGITMGFLYFLVIVALCKRLKIGPCYKIMLLLGLFDMVANLATSVLGVLYLFGWNLCSQLDFVNVWDKLQTSLWCGSCLLSLILLFNRTCHLISTKVVEKFFSSSQIGLWLILSVVYAIFSVPLGNEQNSKVNVLLVNNLLITAVTFLLYFLICAVFICRWKDDFAHQIDRSQRILLIQAIFISAVSLFPAIVGTSFYFNGASHFVARLEQITWRLAPVTHGLAYILLNHTIRRDVLDYLGLNCIKRTTVSKILRAENSVHS